MKPLTSYTSKLTEQQAEDLRAWLQARNYRFREAPYARFAAEKDKTNLVFYESGKLVVQGKGTREFIEFVLEPEILKEARLGYEAVLNPDLLLPRLGVDESGKGDFFGPLCIAGAYVNGAVLDAWKDSGISDSKSISSDKRIRELAELIGNTAGCVTTVVPIGNEAYNRLYVQVPQRQHPARLGSCARHRESDGPKPSHVAASGASHQRPVRLEQGHGRASLDDPGPRNRVGPETPRRGGSGRGRRLDSGAPRIRHALGRPSRSNSRWCFPKGASAAVDAAARHFIAKHGAENLPKVAKMHFRTALRAQGLPEPPKIQWRPRGERLT